MMKRYGIYADCIAEDNDGWWCKWDDVEPLLAHIAKLEAVRVALADLIDNSEGVAGYHLNGDLAPWSELVAGGRYECLPSLDACAEKEAEDV